LELATADADAEKIANVGQNAVAVATRNKLKTP